jgi:aryl-alcohol dehydrogenase-like predicted oxidoreductase
MATRIPISRLGSYGPMVPSLGFGAMGLSVAYSTPGPDEERLKLLDRAWELGLHFWDSADAYGTSSYFSFSFSRLTILNRR